LATARWLALIVATYAILAWTRLASAQPQPGGANPDQLLLGTVTVDSIVEASVRVFSAEDNRGLAFKVEPPPFVTIRDMTLGTQQFGQYGTWSICDITIALSTAVAKDYVGRLKIHIGQGDDTEIPITATVAPSKPGQPRVLVVETPFHKTSTHDGRLFEPWTGLVKAANLDVSSLVVSKGKPILRDIDLSRFDTVLLSCEGLLVMQESDVAGLKRFVQDGGRLVIAANYFFRGTVTKANELLTAAAMTMHDTETMGGLVVEADDIPVGPLTAGIKKIKIHRASPITPTDKEVEILVKDPAAPEQGFVAARRVGKGQVIALGQSLWWSWISTDHDSDNARLMQNLLARRRSD